MKSFFIIVITASEIIFVQSVSKFLWFLPLLIFNPDFFGEWFWFEPVGHASFWNTIIFIVVESWFMWGGFKIIAVIHRSKGDFALYEASGFLKLKVVFLIPFAPIMNFQLKKPYFPRSTKN